MSDGPLSRDWRLIAQEAAQEENPTRLAELIEELSLALDVRNDAEPDQRNDDDAAVRMV